MDPDAGCELHACMLAYEVVIGAALTSKQTAKWGPVTLTHGDGVPTNDMRGVCFCLQSLCP